MNATVIVGTSMTMLVAIIYGFVAFRTSQRSVEPDALWAARGFAAWWWGLAAITAVGALTTILVSLHVVDLAIHLTITYLNVLLLCVALWGLLYYLVFVYTGNPRWLVPIGAFYAAYYGFLLYYIMVGNPSQVTLDGWVATLEYATPQSAGLTLAITGLLLVPQMLAALAYFLLYFKVNDRSQKLRVAATSWGIFFWFGSSLVATIAGFSNTDWWPVVSRAIALSASLVILAAFAPPRWARAKWGLQAYDHHDAEVPPNAW